MKHLLATASAVCRFFPDSATLEQVDVNTLEEFLTQVTFNRALPRVAVADTWYHERSQWTYSFKGKVNSETSGSMYKAAASAAPLALYTANVIPFPPDTIQSPLSEGPYFVNPVGEISAPLDLVETAG